MTPSHETLAEAVAGDRFPPESETDIEAYLIGDCVEGYLSFESGDPEPGPNRAPGFRWGWTNRKRDNAPEDDGFDALRRAHIHASRNRSLLAGRITPETMDEIP